MISVRLRVRAHPLVPPGTVRSRTAWGWGTRRAQAQRLGTWKTSPTFLASGISRLYKHSFFVLSGRVF